MTDSVFPVSSIQELLSTITSGVCLYRVENRGRSGDDYKIIYFNEYALSHEGRTLREIIGKSLKDLRPTIDDYGLIDVFREVWETGEPGFFPARAYIDEKYSNWYENRVFKLSRDIIVAVYDDVSGRYKAEAALRESEERLRQVINTMEKAVAVYEPVDGGEDFIFIEMNRFAEKLTGYTVDQVPGKRISQLFPGESSVGLIKALRECSETGKMVKIPLRQYTDNRITLWVENTIFKLPDGNVVAVFEDTFQQHEAEEALRRSEETLRSYIDNAPLGFFIADANGRYLEVNASASRITGYSREELLAMKIPDMLPEDSREIGMKHFEQVLSNGVANGETPFVRKNGQRGIWAVRAVKLSDDRFMAFSTDVTQNHEMRENLRRNQARYLQAEKNGKVGSWQFDITTSSFWASDGAKSIYGFDSGTDSFTVEEVESRIPRRDEVHQALVDLIENDKPYDLEFQINPMGSASPKIITSVAELVRDEQGHPVKVTGMIQDVTSRVEAGSALRESEEKYRSLFTNIRDAMIITDNNRRLLECNGVFLEMFRCTREDALNRSLEKFYASRSEFESVGEFLSDVAAGVSESFFPAMMQRSDGAEFSAEISLYPRKNAAGDLEGFTGLIRDVSRRVLLEQQVRQSQKMEAIGQLAGGIAHDFNNLLTIINGYSYMLMEGSSPQDKGWKELEEIKKAGHRAASLTRQLLAFSRKQMLKPEIIDLNLRLLETESMLRRLIGEHILLETIIPDEHLMVKADPGQFDQIVLNLAVNSRDAMPLGGRLTISASGVVIDEQKAAEIGLSCSGSLVKITVKDNGCGIDPEHISHIFEPFYTTKGTGEGTGMGLSTVYGIVKQSGGDVQVSSETGRGTEVSVFLPMVQGEEAAFSKAGITAAERSPGELILLVEDEESVRELIRASLEVSGFRIITAGSGDRAVEIAGELQEEPHLLLTDVMMPGISGRELADSVRELFPDTPVCFMSGYTDQTIEKLGVLEGGAFFIQKPFLPSDLIRTIRSILDGKKE